jgi:hypothetical protein
MPPTTAGLDPRLPRLRKLDAPLELLTPGAELLEPVDVVVAPSICNLVE